MTISGYSNAIVDAMLGWLKGLANWVLRLFNLAGSVTGSPLLWLSEKWLKLLVLLIIIGLAVDLLVWLIRWRPYWVWFGKKRVIINDDKFFSDVNLESADEWEDGLLDDNWDERDFVVSSAAVKKHGRPAGKTAHAERQNGRPGTIVRRASDSRGKKKGPAKADGRVRRESISARNADMRNDRRGEMPVRHKGAKHPPERDFFSDDLFGVDTNQPHASDFYEDEVFNVSNLPISDEFRKNDGRN